MTGERVWKCVLVAAVILSIGFAVRQVLKTSARGEARQPVRPIDLVCGACGRETVARPRSMPMKCPSCGKQELAIAAYCGKCGVTLPLLDSALFVKSPYEAASRYPEKVFPDCPKCGRRMAVKYLATQREEPASNGASPGE